MQIRNPLSWEDLESVATMLTGDLRFREGNTVYQGPIESIEFKKDRIVFHLTCTLMWVAPRSQWRKTKNNPIVCRRDQAMLGEEDDGHIGIIIPELRDMEIVLSPQEQIVNFIKSDQLTESNLLCDEI